MWNSFQGALEKKVRNENGFKKKFDKFTVIKAVQIILDNYFGSLGRQYLEVVSVEDGGRLKIKSNQSTWRSELRLRSETIKDEANKTLGQEEIREVIVVS